MKSISEEEIYQITGVKPWHINTVFRNMWIKQYKPEIYKKIYKWLIITDYINFKLCGEIATEFSEASTTLVMDQNQLTWCSTYLMPLVFARISTLI